MSSELIVSAVRFGRTSMDVTADATLTTEQALTRHIELTGSLGGVGKTLSLAAALDGMEWIIDNQAGATVTLRVAGASGVGVPTGKTAILRCNATDVQSVFVEP